MIAAQVAVYTSPHGSKGSNRGKTWNKFLDSLNYKKSINKTDNKVSRTPRDVKQMFSASNIPVPIKTR